ncbi:MAG: GNAT family N-acetyltransferase [Gemmatimonadales bacterium]|nr:GNAT family N-acetyltransferase [Gemmatimonadales bacterium]
MYAAAQQSKADVYPWLPWCHPGYTLVEAEEWSGSRRKLFEQGVEFEFVIVDDEDRFLGGCCLNRINIPDRMANLGYWVRSASTGRGIATRAVQQLADFAFSQTDLERLEIICAVSNEASQRVAQKAGAIREGVLRGRIFLHGRPHDAVMYSILRSEWLAG